VIHGLEASSYSTVSCPYEFLFALIACMALFALLMLFVDKGAELSCRTPPQMKG